MFGSIVSGEEDVAWDVVVDEDDEIVYIGI